jgi:hypothetical protein
MSVPIANVLAEIRALTRDGAMPAELISRLQHRLEEVRDPLQGSTVLAMALLASARGAPRHARELMESVWWLDARAHAAGTVEYAQGWLVTDAAAEGEWKRVLSFVAESPDDATMRLFAHLAARALGLADVPALERDVWYQLPAEARDFHRAFEAKPRAAVPMPKLEEPIAAVLHQLLHSKDTVTTAKEARVLLTSPRLRDRLMERSTLIGGSNPDEALGELRALFEDTLGETMLEVGDDPMLRDVASRRREALVEKLHERIDRLTDLCSEGRAPPMPEVWREFVAIRATYARAVALSEAGERGWPHHVLLRLTRYFGTWLRLTKKELPFAHAVFHFLEVEGARAGDDASARLAKASAELCVPFQLTRG